MTGSSDAESLLRPILGVGLLLVILAVAVGAGVLVALRGIVWLPDAVVRAGFVDEVTTPLVVASALVAFGAAGALLFAILRLGLAAANALGDYLGFESG